MTQNDTWPPWRITRLVKILEYKAQGLTDQQTAQQVGLSRITVNRELNSPQAKELSIKIIDKAANIVWPLVERQLNQLEHSDIKPAQQLSYRGQLIKTLSTLIPRKVEQHIEQKAEVELRGQLKHEWSIEELLGEYGEEISEAIEKGIQDQSRQTPRQNNE